MKESGDHPCAGAPRSSSASSPVAPQWLPGGVAIDVVNDGAVAVAATSHFHFFEVNRSLRFDRAAAWGRRLAIAPGAKARVVRGHGGLVDGPLDAPGAREAALERARERGYRGA